ncbi:MAG: MBL fold metallo-hydrolase [Lachnospiraceae bacterium]|nr:MBL fold metallo-hydrolase [Lachnospiraceae bacterium]
MESWFTVEEIDRETFAISEYRHWEETHCYLICGKKCAILVDTGLGISNIRKIVDSLTELPVMVVTTHIHWDHIGGHKYFDNIAVHEAEKDWLSVRFPIPLQAVKKNLTKPPCDFPADFDIDAYQIFQGIPQGILHDGDSLNLGGREIQVIHTPGHYPGHHQLNISVSLIHEIENGFEQLEEAGKLKQGKGMFDFGDLQIHI